MSKIIKLKCEVNSQIEYPSDYNTLVNKIQTLFDINNPKLIFIFKNNNGEDVIKEIGNEEDYQEYKKLYENSNSSIEIKIKKIISNEIIKKINNEGKNKINELKNITENQSKKIKNFEYELKKIEELQTQVQFLTKQLFKINKALDSKKEKKNENNYLIYNHSNTLNERKKKEEEEKIQNREIIDNKNTITKKNEEIEEKKEEKKEIENKRREDNIKNPNSVLNPTFNSMDKKQNISFKFIKSKDIVIDESIIKQNKTIHHKIKVLKNGIGNYNLPEYTFIRCINNDSDIYFYHSNEIEIEVDDNQNTFIYFKVIILFKNYSTIKEGRYTLSYQLMSDFSDINAHEIGYLIVRVTK